MNQNTLHARVKRTALTRTRAPKTAEYQRWRRRRQRHSDGSRRVIKTNQRCRAPQQQQQHQQRMPFISSLCSLSLVHTRRGSFSYVRPSVCVRASVRVICVVLNSSDQYALLFSKETRQTTATTQHTQTHTDTKQKISKISRIKSEMEKIS